MDVTQRLPRRELIFKDGVSAQLLQKIRELAEDQTLMGARCDAYRGSTAAIIEAECPAFSQGFHDF